MSKAIFTKYLPATNVKGSRIKAYAEGGNQVVRSYDHALNADQNHAAAAKALASKMGWAGHYVQGGHADGKQSVFVEMGCAWAETFVIDKDEANETQRKLAAQRAKSREQV